MFPFGKVYPNNVCLNKKYFCLLADNKLLKTNKLLLVLRNKQLKVPFSLKEMENH